MNTYLVRLSLGYFCLAMLWILLGDTLVSRLVAGDDQACLARCGQREETLARTGRLWTDVPL